MSNGPFVGLPRDLWTVSLVSVSTWNLGSEVQFKIVIKAIQQKLSTTDNGLLNAACLHGGIEHWFRQSKGENCRKQPRMSWVESSACQPRSPRILHDSQSNTLDLGNQLISRDSKTWNGCVRQRRYVKFEVLGAALGTWLETTDLEQCFQTLFL